MTTTPDYAIRFEVISKRALLTINATKKADTGPSVFDPAPSNILVPLDAAFQPGRNTVTLQVFNDVQAPATLSSWRVRYKIEIRGETAAVIDYSGGFTQAGIVLELQHAFYFPYDPAKAPDYSAAVKLY